MEIGLLDDKVAVITDEDGIVCAVVREGEDEAYLMNFCHLAEQDPSLWDREAILDDPLVRNALGLPEEVRERDLIASSRPSNAPKAKGKRVVSWSFRGLRDFLSRRPRH